jgi:hypothetical protein
MILAACSMARMMQRHAGALHADIPLCCTSLLHSAHNPAAHGTGTTQKLHLLLQSEIPAPCCACISKTVYSLYGGMSWSYVLC